MTRAIILSASAGSGKTYQLALKYVCDVVRHPEKFRNILAVTFTNKATEEMKSRILREIDTLASGKESSYIEKIQELTGFSEAHIRSQAMRARTHILHDYSHFSVLTIDRFFQRILRAFIKELGVDLNYNIELDTKALIKRSADELIDDIADDKDLRKWMLEYAEERIVDGVKWDMRSDLRAMGDEIFNECANIGSKIDKNELSNKVNSIVVQANEHCSRIQELGRTAVKYM
jgi:ATP-dependent exoDNAse (exonuclease V) beta subunit